MSVQAAARGTLAERPLPRLLQQLFRKRVTGYVALVDDSKDESRIYLRDGAPVHVVRPNDLDRLDRVLLDSGVLPPAQVARAVEIQEKTKNRMGEILMQEGMLLPQALGEILKTQIRRKITRLFFAREGTFEIFVEEHDYGVGVEFAAMRIDPRSLVYSAIRAAYDAARIEEALRPLAGRSFRLVGQSGPIVAQMGFSAKDAVLAALATQALTLDDLPKLRGKVSDARAAVLTLFHTDLLEFPEAAVAATPAPMPLPDLIPFAPPSPSTPPPVVTPAPASTAASALRARIEDLFTRVGRMSHFEILGVTESATPDQANAAYMQAIRQLHPDRLAGAGAGDLAKQAEQIVARMTEAAGVLGDARKRAAYTASLAGATPGVDPALAILEAEQIFNKGEDHLKKNEFSRAAQAFAQAAKKNPGEPEYAAYLAWARFATPGSAKGSMASEIMGILQETIKRKAQFTLAHFWIGQIWKFLGDMPKAEQAFRHALAVDKGMFEAEREVRLIEMRRAQSMTNLPRVSASARTADGGIFGKFFKR